MYIAIEKDKRYVIDNTVDNHNIAVKFTDANDMPPIHNDNPNSMNWFRLLFICIYLVVIIEINYTLTQLIKTVTI